MIIINNEINFVKAFSKYKNVFKKVRVRSKTYVGSTFEKDIQELDPRKAYKYLGMKESHDVEHKNEKEKLKNE
jgi:hypothetical protein